MDKTNMENLSINKKNIVLKLIIFIYCNDCEVLLIQNPFTW